MYFYSTIIRIIHFYKNHNNSIKVTNTFSPKAKSFSSMISLGRSLLRKYSYLGRRSNVDPLHNTPWKRSLVLARLGSERALRAVSVNCYVQTRGRSASRTMYI